MNSNTRDNLERFAELVADLAHNSVHIIGTECASDVIAAARELQLALEEDETIIEST